MRETLEHYILKMEKMIYENTRIWQGKDTTCNRGKKLPCNCLTGLTLNYLGYMITNCWRIDLECALEMGGDIKFIMPQYQGDKLAPVFPKERDSEKYLGHKFVCSKESVLDDKIYIRIDSFQNMEELDRRITNTDKYQKRRMHEAGIISEFMLRFLIAVRTQPIKAECNSLLAMALFLHPKRTLELIDAFLSREDISKENREIVKELFDAYMKMLEGLEIESKMGYDYEFLFRFSELFEELTNVYIGNWIEKIQEDKGNDFIYQALYAAYNRNKEELVRRGSYFHKIEAKLKAS